MANFSNEGTTMTIPDLADQVRDAMSSYVRNQQQYTHLTASMTTGDLTFTVADIDQISRGLVEIDDELMAVQTVDPDSNVVTLEPWGRAQSGSPAATHATNAKVVANPLYPRQGIANVIYGVLRESFPDLAAFGKAFLDPNPAKTNYPLPTTAWTVLGVQNKLPGPTGMWKPVTRWRVNRMSDTDPIELEILGPVWPGSQRVRVLYMKTPPAQWLANDDLIAYGYDNGVKDVIVLGAVARLLAYTEPARLQMFSVEAAARAETVQAGAAEAVARQVYALFKQRLTDERTQQQSRFPTQPHLTR